MIMQFCLEERKGDPGLSRWLWSGPECLGGYKWERNEKSNTELGGVASGGLKRGGLKIVPIFKRWEC